MAVASQGRAERIATQIEPQRAARLAWGMLF
jgi:hypothetical protein